MTDVRHRHHQATLSRGPMNFGAGGAIRRIPTERSMTTRSTAMSYVTVAPEMLAAAATDMQSIGSALSAANAAAAAPDHRVAGRRRR